METKERPILFSGEMVRAILAGRKTMTRRAVKPQPVEGEGVRTCPHCASDWAYTVNGGACSCSGVTNRYGNPGDRLWVKETFCEMNKDLHGPLGVHEKLVFRADCKEDAESKRIMREYGYKWKPSIFMPRGASRITLEIVSTRIERLNDICDEDAKAEGVSGMFGKSSLSDPAYRCAYRILWEKINGAGSWDANPCVWVIEFKRLEGGSK